MGQPTPPGDNVPLFEGLGPEWNDIVGAIPEDRRAELAPKLKERISAFEPLQQYSDFAKSGITPEQISTSLNLFSIIENNPKEVYETLGKHLNITPAQAEQVVEQLEESDGSDPEIAALKQQVETLAQIALAQRQQTTQEKMAAEQDALLDSEIQGIKKKYGNDVPEDEILMRMLHKNMTAEEAYTEYSSRAEDIRKRRPAPFVMGQGGHVPNQQLDVKTLDNKSTKNLVAQMLDHANSLARE
jgi:hypothetical protein